MRAKRYRGVRTYPVKSNFHVWRQSVFALMMILLPSSRVSSGNLEREGIQKQTHSTHIAVQLCATGKGQRAKGKGHRLWFWSSSAPCSATLATRSRSSPPPPPFLAQLLYTSIPTRLGAFSVVFLSQHGCGFGDAACGASRPSAHSLHLEGTHCLRTQEPAGEVTTRSLF